MRSGFFTPTEAVVVAVFYGFVVGKTVYRTLDWKDSYTLLVESAEIVSVILTVFRELALWLPRKQGYLKFVTPGRRPTGMTTFSVSP